MACHILADQFRNHAVLFCSTSDWAFGPVFAEQDGHDAEERAEAFLRWLDATPLWFTYERASLVPGRRDARLLTEDGLQRAYADWQAQESTQWAAEDAALFAAEE